MRRLRRAGVEYLVVKNTLALRALAGAKISGLDAHFEGPTAVALTVWRFPAVSVRSHSKKGRPGKASRFRATTLGALLFTWRMST